MAEIDCPRTPRSSVIPVTLMDLESGIVRSLPAAASEHVRSGAILN
jgi:hypothetical protein